MESSAQKYEIYFIPNKTKKGSRFNLNGVLDFYTLTCALQKGGKSNIS